MAKTTVEREECGVATLNCFEFDENNLYNDDIKVKFFTGYNLEWARFVRMNRSNKTNAPLHPYDIVYGPIANDKIGLQMWRLANGYINEKRFAKEIEFLHPTFQYFFGTERAIQLLKRI